MIQRPILFLSAALFSLPSAVLAEVRSYTNPQSGLITWESAQDGFSIELIQLLPDFVRAIYAKHDFPKDEIERIASWCVFGTIIKNTSDSELIYDVSEWRYTAGDGERHPVKTKTQWLREWKQAGVTFSWTLLPDKGVFLNGDWQQGFTTIQLPRESKFDLIYNWRVDGVEHEFVLEDLKCAPGSL